MQSGGAHGLFLHAGVQETILHLFVGRPLEIYIIHSHDPDVPILLRIMVAIDARSHPHLHLYIMENNIEIEAALAILLEIEAAVATVEIEMVELQALKTHMWRRNFPRGFIAIFLGAHNFNKTLPFGFIFSRMLFGQMIVLFVCCSS